MSKVTIYVSREGKSNHLHLRDSEGHSGESTITTDVHTGDTVQWVLRDGIDEITGIQPKKGSQNIFSNGPARQEDGSWEGKVSKSAAGSELYTIDYKIGIHAFSDDPKIKVKPPRE